MGGSVGRTGGRAEPDHRIPRNRTGGLYRAAQFRVTQGRHAFVERLAETGLASGERRGLLENRTLPIVEPGTASFVWLGRAETVVLRHFMTIPHGPFPFERIGEELWHLRLMVPDKARFEYKIDIGRNGRGDWTNDPLNPELATDPFGANSVCRTSGYTVPDWTVPDPAASEGTIERFEVASASFGGTRPAGVYLPAGYDPGRRYPLVVVHDGFDYVEHAALRTVLDNLIHRGDLPPLIAALTRSPDRTVEYVDDPRHARFVSEELVEAVEARWSLDPEPARRILMGASLGAIASLSIADRNPRAFGGLVLKSGSFVLDRRKLATRAELFRRVHEFVDDLAEDERLARRAFVTCGRYEGLASDNRQMSAFLRQTGVRTRYTEPKDAHHWQNWRDQTRAGLMWCLNPEPGDNGAPGLHPDRPSPLDLDHALPFPLGRR